MIPNLVSNWMYVIFLISTYFIYLYQLLPRFLLFVVELVCKNTQLNYHKLVDNWIKTSTLFSMSLIYFYLILTFAILWWTFIAIFMILQFVYGILWTIVSWICTYMCHLITFLHTIVNIQVDYSIWKDNWLQWNMRLHIRCRTLPFESWIYCNTLT